MRQKKAISDAVIERLPLYYRDLLLLQDAGIDIISSEKLGERLGITPEQIRKDLTCFGAFGKKGVGYYVSEMGDVIRREGIQIGIITTPAAVAQQVADQMVDAGIRGILSFAPLRLTVPDGIFVFREDLSIGLSRISYYLTNKTE